AVRGDHDAAADAVRLYEAFAGTSAVRSLAELTDAILGRSPRPDIRRPPALGPTDVFALVAAAQHLDITWLQDSDEDPQPWEDILSGAAAQSVAFTPWPGLSIDRLRGIAAMLRGDAN